MIARILKLGFNDIRLTWKDKGSLIWMVIMPFVFILFFGGVVGGGSNDPSDRTITMTVVDNDVSWLSRSLLETLRGEDFAVTEVDADELQGTEGRIRTLIIPQGLADAVAAKQQVTLFLAREPDANDRATMLAEIHVFRAVVQLLGSLVEMQVVAGGDEPLDLQVDRVLQYRELNDRDPLVVVDATFAGRGRPVPQGFGQAIPGMLTQFIVMMTMIAGSVYLTSEKVSGVLRRVAVSGFTPRTVIAGKMSGLVMLALLQAAILIVGASLIGYFGILGADFYWGSSPLGLLLLVLSFSIATGGITLFYGAVLSTPAQGSAVGWLSGMIMAGMGGCWWPMEVVPDWLQDAGHIFPTAWMMDGLHELVSFGKGLDAVIPEVMVLLGFGLAFGWLGSRFLKVQA